MDARWPLYLSPDHWSYFSSRSLGLLLETEGFVRVREEWRFMYTPDGVNRLVVNRLMKLAELLRVTTLPIHDHYYCYARKGERS